MEALAQDTVVDGAIMDAPQVPTRSPKFSKSKKSKRRMVGTSVSGHSVIVKRMPLPMMTEEEAVRPDSIRSQPTHSVRHRRRESQLPVARSDGFADGRAAGGGEERQDLNHTNVLAQAGKTPVVVDIDAFGLQKLL